MCHKKIKVALIDNMNNNFFAFARYLRDEGIDVHLYEISNSSHDHFQAQADTFEDVKNLEWIFKFPTDIKYKTWLLFNKKILQDTCNQYDLIISCGMASAYLKRAGINSDIIIPYGSDLYSIPFKKVRYSLSLDFFKSLFDSNMAIYQKKAYQNARVITINADSDFYGDPLKKMQINWINQSMPMLYNLENTLNIELNNYIDQKVLNTLDISDFIVFNHARQYWASNEDNLKDFDKFLGAKRNDKVIKAFATFLKNTNFKKPLLALFEYGKDVLASKELIEKLGIEDNVVWFPKSHRKVILMLLKKYANIGTDQFREGLSSGFSGVSYEVLASSVPLLKHNTNLTEYFKKSPVIECLSENDILDIFIDYEKNPQKYKEIGQKSKEWFDEHLGLELAKKYVKLIELLVSDKSLTQNDKIVRDIFES